ncbi:hypothetical protein ACFE04_015780 [Oxalis oulophora]
MANMTGFYSDSTLENDDSDCSPLDSEVNNTKGKSPALLSENNVNWLSTNDFLNRESEEDDSLSLDGDRTIDSSCSLSIASETSSLCGDDFNFIGIGFESASEIGTPCVIERETSTSSVDIISKASEFGESNTETESIRDPADGSGSNPSHVDLQLALEERVRGSGARSVFEMEYVPLWGYTSICGRRPEMEDAFATVPRFLEIPIQMLIGNRVLDGVSNSLTHQTAHFFGVYDGHGGSQGNSSLQVANYCRDRVHTALVEEIEAVKERQNIESTNASCVDQWKTAFTNCFIKVDAEVSGTGGVDPVAPETVGSTAVVAVICSSHIIVANCGDSRAVLCRGKEPIALSVDHKPNREDECARIEAAGGRVIQWNGHRVFGVLAMSRSIERVEGIDPAAQAAAEYLSNQALKKGSKDNITVVVVDLKAQKKFKSKP